MTPFSSFVQFVTTGGVGYLFLDWTMTLACLIMWYQLRPLFASKNEGHWCKASNRYYLWPQENCAHCNKGEAS